MATSKIITNPVLLSYLFALEPKTNKSGKTSYGAMLIWPKSDKTMTKMVNDAIQAAFIEDKEGKNHLKAKGDVLPKNIKTTLYDGDEAEEESFSTTVEGCYYLNVSSNRKIDIVDKNREVITDPDEIYSGMYGRCLLQFKAYNNDNIKGITAYVNGIQKTKNGSRLDGVTDPSKAFDDGYDDFEEDDDYEAPKKTKKVVEEDDWDSL